MSKKDKEYKFIISGGGTGGHIFPAIAIGNALKLKFPEAQIEFVGAKDRMEMLKVPEAGFKIHGLWISGIQRKLTLGNLMFPFKLISSLIKSQRIIKKFKPNLVIGVGGFASGPLLYAAGWSGIPSLIQEQNSYPGITNKLLASRVDKICVAFDKMERFFPANKIILTGNPIRQNLLKCDSSVMAARQHFGLDPKANCILIIGGSLGARTINNAIAKNLKVIQESGVNILWQTGKFYAEQHAVPGRQTVFIKEMDLAYKAADLVISRAGASSLSEICALGKAAILVPSPNVAEDHQTRNAQALVEKEAAILVKDSDASELLVKTALTLLLNKGQIEEMSRKALALAKPNATSDIINEIVELLGHEN